MLYGFIFTKSLFNKNNLFMKKIIVLVFILAVFINIQAVQASLINNTDIQTQAESFREGAGLASANGDASLGGIVATLINTFIGLLAIIFIVLLVMAGYKYMTAGGNEDKTKEAIDSIRRAIIGLIIIFSAYAITYFVFNSLDWFNSGGEMTM